MGLSEQWGWGWGQQVLTFQEFLVEKALKLSSLNVLSLIQTREEYRSHSVPRSFGAHLPDSKNRFLTTVPTECPSHLCHEAFSDGSRPW